MKPAILVAAIVLAACANTPKQEAGGSHNNDELFTAGGQACPPGSVRPQLPVSYSGITDSGCRTKFDWQRMREISRTYDRCLNDAKNPTQEAACRYKMQ